MLARAAEFSRDEKFGEYIKAYLSSIQNSNEEKAAATRKWMAVTLRWEKAHSGFLKLIEEGYDGPEIDEYIDALNRANAFFIERGEAGSLQVTAWLNEILEARSDRRGRG